MGKEKRVSFFLFSCGNKEIHLRLVRAFIDLICRFNIIDKGVFDVFVDKFIKGVFKFWTGSIQCKIRVLFKKDFFKDPWQNSSYSCKYRLINVRHFILITKRYNDQENEKQEQDNNNEFAECGKQVCH